MRSASLAPAIAALSLVLCTCVPGAQGQHSRSPGNSSVRPGAPSSSPTSTQAAVSPSPGFSPALAATPTPLEQLPPLSATAIDLTFTGVLVGRVLSGQAQGTCGRLVTGYSAQLQFSVSGEPLVLGIQIFDYRGPAQYQIPPERISVHSPGVGSGSRFLPAVNGSVRVDSGETSGTLDAALGDGGGSGRVQGTWTCSR